MSDQDPDRLPPDLAALLAPEKSPGAALGKERVRARVESTLFGPGGGGGGGDHGPSGLSPLVRAAALVVAGAVAGGVAVYALVPPREVVVERIVEKPAPPPSAADTSSVALPIATHPVEPAPSASASAAPTIAPADSLAQERAILDPARVAIGRGDGASALDAVHRHEQKFPQGKLTEEREAIAVQALVLAHQPDAARARGQKFLARWPGSVLRPAVEAAVAAAAPP